MQSGTPRASTSTGTEGAALAPHRSETSQRPILLAAGKRLSRLPRPRPKVRVKCHVRRIPPAGTMASAIRIYRQAAGIYLGAALRPMISVCV